jgi:HK97 family phage portal protein
VGIWNRLFGARAVKAAEGAYRPGPYMIDGGWLSSTAGRYMNWWQLGHSVTGSGTCSAITEACIGAYSQTIAMCPGDHWRRDSNGGRSRVSNSPVSRVLRRPNDYQSISDFLLNLTRSLYVDGNAYALAVRDERFDISELHLMSSRACSPQLTEDGEVFYHLGGNDIIDRRFGSGLIVPARDVLHVRLHAPRHPLKGETPIMAAAMDVAASNAILAQQIAFFSNQARPSYMLSTDAVLTRDQSVELRAAWDMQTKGDNAGGTPILTAGLKPVSVATSSRDSQLAETMKMTQESVALVMRVPLQILGIGGTPYASTEMLMQSWYASGLGFALNHIEEAFGLLFGLRGVPDEYVEFDTRALMRSAHLDRIEALVRGIQGGLFSPDEGRAEFELPEVPGGHGKEPRLQQQVMPLSWHTQPAAPAPPAAPSPPSSPEDAERDADLIVERLYEHARLH